LFLQQVGNKHITEYWVGSNSLIESQSWQLYKHC